ncbi:hypothetical protein BKI52_13050 [marine bacterium AO1-C]|nr:hypothetical protein BKI52_13050 [marine bacterium AO1-C]
MSEVFNIESIHQLHYLAGGPPPNHPLFCIHQLEDIQALDAKFPEKFTYNFYCTGLKKNLPENIQYGRSHYDFQEGVMGFTAPLQVMSFERHATENATGWVIFFHKDLMNGTPLQDKIDQYGFFHYNVDEGLFLSPKEEEAMMAIFQNIATEYQRPIDQHSKQVVLSNLELLFTYAERFYARQFIVRNDTNPDILRRFEQTLKAYFNQSRDLPALPTVEYFADQLNLSANYLSDLLKSLTGKSTLEHIHYQIIEMAKHKILGTNQSMAEIAFELGFEYPQYFSRLFKNKTGMTPKEFRLSSN